MSEHDPLCPIVASDAYYLCSCPLIRLVRADERERIAAAIEAAAAEWYAEPGAMSAAARIARNGGSDG